MTLLSPLPIDCNLLIRQKLNKTLGYAKMGEVRFNT